MRICIDCLSFLCNPMCVFDSVRFQNGRWRIWPLTVYRFYSAERRTQKKSSSSVWSPGVTFSRTHAKGVIYLYMLIWLGAVFPLWTAQITLNQINYSNLCFHNMVLNKILFWKRMWWNGQQTACDVNVLFFCAGGSGPWPVHTGIVYWPHVNSPKQIWAINLNWAQRLAVWT